MNGIKITLLLLIIANATFAQEWRVPYRSGDLWGYANQNGTVIIEPKYDSVSLEDDNARWEVYKDGNVGVINENGEELLKIIYDSLKSDPQHSRYNNFYLFKNGLAGYANLNGEIVVPPNYPYLEACDLKDLSYPVPKYFFIKENADFSILDSNLAVLFSGIQNKRSLQVGFYFFEMNGKWGLYNVYAESWGIEAKYDEMDMLWDWQGSSKKNVLYGIRGKEVDLFDRKFEVETISLEAFNYAMKKADDEKVISTVEFPYENENYAFRDLRSFKKSSEGQIIYKKHFFSEEIGNIQLIKEKSKFGLTIVNEFEKNLPAEYDSIHVYCNDVDEIYFPYFKVFKSTKEGVYGAGEDRLILPVAMDSIKFGRAYGRHGDLLVLYQNSKVGIRLLPQRNSSSNPLYVAPIYDKLVKRGSITSYDDSHDGFDVFFFEHNGRIVLVGRNGVRFCDD